MLLFRGKDIKCWGPSGVSGLCLENGRSLYHNRANTHHLTNISSPMLSLRPSSRLCLPKQLGRVVQVSVLSSPAGLRLASQQPRHFSTTPATQLRDFFPEKETAYIRKTPPSWPHQGYTEEEVLSVVPEHREPKTVGDWLAWKLVRIARYVAMSIYVVKYV